jgi:hypothetical protein
VKVTYIIKITATNSIVAGAPYSKSQTFYFKWESSLLAIPPIGTEIRTTSDLLSDDGESRDSWNFDNESQADGCYIPFVVDKVRLAFQKQGIQHYEVVLRQTTCEYYSDMGCVLTMEVRIAEMFSLALPGTLKMLLPDDEGLGWGDMINHEKVKHDEDFITRGPWHDFKKCSTEYDTIMKMLRSWDEERNYG